MCLRLAVSFGIAVDSNVSYLGLGLGLVIGYVILGLGIRTRVVGA